MKTIFALLLTGALLLTSACSNATASGAEPSTQSEASQSGISNAIAPPSDSDAKRQPKARTNENSVTGKIVSVTQKEITLTLAVSNRPEGGPGREDAASGQSEDNSGSASQARPGRPAGDASGSRPKGEARQGFGGKGMIEFTGETKTYTLSDTVTVQSGMGKDAQTVELASLAIDSVVRVVLNENEQVVSISLMPVGTGGNPPSRGETGTSVASE